MNDFIIDFYNDELDVLKEKVAKAKENSEKFKIVLHHYSSSNDNEKSILENGLVPASELLSNSKSPMFLFLKENGIEIDVERRKIRVYSKEEDIKDGILLCKINNGADVHGISLFCYDKGNYQSSIKYCPEIIVSINEYLKKYYGNFELSKKWCCSNNKQFICKCTVPLDYVDEINLERILRLYENEWSDDEFVVYVFRRIGPSLIEII